MAPGILARRAASVVRDRLAATVDPMQESTPRIGRDPAIRVTMMPRETNVNGTIFGGVILSHIDQAGAIAARPYAYRRVVTVAMKEVEFHAPVFVGDIVSFYAAVTRVGTTSITVHVDVVAERFDPPGQMVDVTEADVIYVAVDDRGQKMSVRRPDGSE